MYCKAWGFAGASIALGSKIEFGAEGFMIPDVFQVNDEQLTHDLELGLKAGLEVGGFLLWYPPSGYPDFLVDKTKRSHQLIKGALKLESSITVKVPVRFRFANKKLSIGLSIAFPPLPNCLLREKSIRAWSGHVSGNFNDYYDRQIIIVLILLKMMKHLNNFPY